MNQLQLTLITGVSKTSKTKEDRNKKECIILIFIMQKQVKIINTWCFQVRTKATLEGLGSEWKGVLGCC